MTTKKAASKSAVVRDHERVVAKAERRLKEAQAALKQAEKDEAKTSTKRKG
jgi:hypothetical protein